MLHVYAGALVEEEARSVKRCPRIIERLHAGDVYACLFGGDDREQRAHNASTDDRGVECDDEVELGVLAGDDLNICGEDGARPLSDRPFHFELDQVVHLHGVFQGQFL